ncbi:hypothetical protein AT864_02833 [Anoxybacillus sp. P3H1B]|nr:hypothetical protein AT864_02833 [Anoxybacillus sp. P3H1B]
MIAPMDLHLSHGGVPSHVSRSPSLLHSFVQPIHEVEVGICSLAGSMPEWGFTTDFSVLLMSIFDTLFEIRQFPVMSLSVEYLVSFSLH